MILRPSRSSAIFILLPLLLSVAIVAMWARSYFVASAWPPLVRGSGIQVQSWDGRLFVSFVELRWTSPCTIHLSFALSDGLGPSNAPATQRELAKLSPDKVQLISAPTLTFSTGELSSGFGFDRATMRIGKGSQRVIVRAFVVPYWSILAIPPLVILAATLWQRVQRKPPLPGVCHSCGYDLRATPGRCPECGTVPVTVAR